MDATLVAYLSPTTPRDNMTFQSTATTITVTYSADDVMDKFHGTDVFGNSLIHVYDKKSPDVTVIFKADCASASVCRGLYSFLKVVNKNNGKLTIRNFPKSHVSILETMGLTHLPNFFVEE